MKSLPERVRWAREKRGYSCAELDEIADLSCGHSAKIEAGTRGAPSSLTVSKLAHALGVGSGWLIDGGKPPQLKRAG